MLGNVKYYLSQFNMIATLVAKLESYLALRAKMGLHLFVASEFEHSPRTTIMFSKPYFFIKMSANIG